MRQLDSLYLSNSSLAFTTAADMIQHLADCFEEIDEKADAIDQYALLRQGETERFRDFKVRFLDLANKSETSRDSQLHDIFRKCNTDLQDRLLTERRSWTSLAQAIKALDGADKELASFRRRNQVRLSKRNES